MHKYLPNFCKIDGRAVLLRQTNDVDCTFKLSCIKLQKKIKTIHLFFISYRYFSGLLRLYGRQEFLNQAKDKVTLNKKSISKEARETLEKKLSLDIEFYEYLSQRLFNQANKSGTLPTL